MSNTEIQWTKHEVECFLSLPEPDQVAVIDSLTAAEKDSLFEAIANGQQSKSTQEKRRASSREANARTAADGATVLLPTLSDADRQLREKLEADDEAWIWHMCGPGSQISEELTRSFTSQQCDMISIYKEALTHGGDDLMLASRGEGKTTYLRAMIMKSIAEGRCNFVAFIGATGDDANNSRTTIQDMICRSVRFIHLYPEIALPCMRAEVNSQLAKGMRATGERFDNGERFEKAPIGFQWSEKGVRLPAVPGSPSYRAMLEFRGADKPIRGLNKYGRRPQIVCIDDIDSPNTVNNAEVAEKIVDRIDTDIGGLGTPTQRVARIFLATLPKTGIGVAYHYARQGFPFAVRTYKYLVKKPIEWEMWMEYVKLRQRHKKTSNDKYGRVAHKFYLDNFELMNAGAEVSNTWRFDDSTLPDGSQMQVSALQNYFDEWADKGEFFCRCELDNELIEVEGLIENRLDTGHVVASENELSLSRLQVDPTSSVICRGVDVRKMELHWADVSREKHLSHRITNYENKAHGGMETTVEQAEELIYQALHDLADTWESERFYDADGNEYRAALTLIDKGWKGSWKEDGETKTWASQPVERFCKERGLRHFMPAKGSGSTGFRLPAPSPSVILGDNWYINRGRGAERICDEVIWNSEHWHSLVEGLFLLPLDQPDRFVLFHGEDGYWKNHKRFAQHIYEGCEDLTDQRRRATRTRKPKYRRDHWWDALAMTLVAFSVESVLRQRQARRQRRSLSEMKREASR